MVVINLNYLTYTFTSKKGFENIHFTFSPNVDRELPFMERVPKIKSEYEQLKSSLILNLGFKIEDNSSLEQKISNDSITEKIELKRKVISNTYENYPSFLKSVLSVEKPKKDKFDALILDYTISDSPSISLVLYEFMMSQQSILDVYQNIFNLYDVNLSKSAAKSKNQIEFILSQKGKPVSIDSLLLA